MANPFYQPPLPRPAAASPDRFGRGTRFAREVIRRFSARFARRLRLFAGPHRCVGDGRDAPGRDVLWRAKRNALHRALADHDLTALQARAILCRLSAVRGHGCELACLGPLTGVDAGVLDRAVPLLGLQNFLTVRETETRGSSGPILWVSATEHGLRYAAEAFAVSAPAPGAETPQERA